MIILIKFSTNYYNSGLTVDSTKAVWLCIRTVRILYSVYIIVPWEPYPPCCCCCLLPCGVAFFTST